MKKLGKRKPTSGFGLHDKSSLVEQGNGTGESDNGNYLMTGFSAATLQHLHKIFTSFILFDWEFFNNELEFE